MKILLIAIGIIILIALALWGIKFYQTIQVSRKLIHSAVPYQLLSADHTKTMLVLGDSTAVGVGAATSSETLAGRVQAYSHMTYVENDAVSGAVTADLQKQRAQAKLAHYNLILIQIGGNDIIRFHSAAQASKELTEALKSLPSADKVIVIAPGDVGGSTLFPKPINLIYTWLNKQYSKDFSAAVPAVGSNMVFINFSTSPATKTIKDNPKTYLAADGLHPSSAGYQLWFNDIKQELP